MKNFNMKYYKVTVKEILGRTATVKAESEDDAHGKVERMYYDEKVVLDYSDHINTDFVVLKKSANMSF